MKKTPRPEPYVPEFARIERIPSVFIGLDSGHELIVVGGTAAIRVGSGTWPMIPTVLLLSKDQVDAFEIVSVVCGLDAVTFTGPMRALDLLSAEDRADYIVRGDASTSDLLWEVHLGPCDVVDTDRRLNVTIKNRDNCRRRFLAVVRGHRASLNPS